MNSDRLLDAIEHELRPRCRLRFGQEVEALFEQETHQARQRHLVIMGLVSALIYTLFLINDYSLRPEAFLASVVIRGVILLPMALAIFWWVYRGVPPWLRETLMAGLVVIAMIGSSTIFYISSSPYSYLDVFSFGLILLAGNIVFSLRFPYALVSSVISIAVMGAFVFHYELMPVEAKRLAMFAIVVKAVFTLMANYRLEYSMRISFLLLMREKIKAGNMQSANHQLTRLSVTDPLTDIANRRQFDAIFPAHWQVAQLEQRYLAIMVIDIDHFKAYNDYYGHLQGDLCLRQVAAALQSNSRSDDLVVRYGGEEFVILMPRTEPHTAR
ncbi:MAG: diguanylate cyclase, partial [Halomonas sp.]|nr:diguanylate cyclase [Halomonas sp.]